MGNFWILRKQFLDRVFALDELEALAVMLRQWYIDRTSDRGQSGRVYCSCRIFSFARLHEDAIRKSLSKKLPNVTFEASDPDELRIVGPALGADRQTDLSVWREVLADRLLEHACVMLRLTFTGKITSFKGIEKDGTTTFVICGAPVNGALLAKAIWRLGQDESMESTYQLAPWYLEQKLLDEFELFYRESSNIRLDYAATVISPRFDKERRRLFMTRGDERKVMWLIRYRAELPDDSGPMAFMRRLSLPLLGCLFCAMLAVVFSSSRAVKAIGIAAGAYFLFSAARIVWKKLRRIRRYYSGMRRGLGILYSNPVHHRQTDLSHDKTPTLLKFSAELEGLGARHVCDVSITTARGAFDGNRIYALGDMLLTVGLLRQTETLCSFRLAPS